MIAGIVFIAVGRFAVGVHSSGSLRLEYDVKFRSRFRPRSPPEA